MFKVIAGMLVLPIPVLTQACPITHYVDCRYMLLVVILLSIYREKKNNSTG